MAWPSKAKPFIIRQARLIPGIYHRRKENGELEAQFNVKRATGHNFRVRLEPATGIYRFDIGDNQLQLYPILKALGVQDDHLKQLWGPEVWQANASKPDRGSLAKAYAKLVKKPDLNASPEAQAQAVKDALTRMRVNPEAVALTLPQLAEQQRKAASAGRYGAGCILRTKGGWLVQENDDGTLRPVGGGYEESDGLLRRTILRELEEELGIDPAEANPQLLYLGRIVDGPYANCAMFELPAPTWLSQGMYQASNSKDEKIKLVFVSTLEECQYIGRHRHELDYPGDTTPEEIMELVAGKESTAAKWLNKHFSENNLPINKMNLRSVVARLKQPALQALAFVLLTAGTSKAASALPVWADKYEAYLWQVENAQQVGFNKSAHTWKTYDDHGTPAVGPGIQVPAYGVYDEADVARLLKQRVVKHASQARAYYDKTFGTGSFDHLPAERQMALTDMDYNPGLSKFPKFAQAVHDNDWLAATREGVRNSALNFVSADLRAHSRRRSLRNKRYFADYF